MTTVLDVARYILEKQGELEATKLQKLCYYAQGWSLAWEGKPLFETDLQAWVDGPVSPWLYQRHRTWFSVRAIQIDGDPSNLTEAQRCIVDAVLRMLGHKSAKVLIDMTHIEPPWLAARGDLPPQAKSEAVISKDAIRIYFQGLLVANRNWAEEPVTRTVERVTANRRELLRRLA